MSGEPDDHDHGALDLEPFSARASRIGAALRDEWAKQPTMAEVAEGLNRVFAPVFFSFPPEPNYCIEDKTQ